jgi:microcystin-dependent protein
MDLQLKNNASSTLAGAILAADTSFSVAAGEGAKFPALSAGQWFPLTVVDSSANLETMKCTARSGDVLTVSRGQEGTTAAAFTSGSRVDLRITAGAIADIQSLLDTLSAAAAPLASPALTGNPTAPTQANGDTSTKIATDAFVNDALVNGTPGAGLTKYAGVPSNTVVFTLAATAPAGWLMFNDGTMGNASSGAGHAAADAQAVFDALYAVADADCPLLTSSGSATSRTAQGTASAAWAANCRMSLPKALGHAFGAAGAGSGLTSRALAASAGTETHALTQSELSVALGTASSSTTTTLSSGARLIPQDVPENGIAQDGVKAVGGAASTIATITASSSTTTTITNSLGGNAHTNMQPSLFLNAMVKL